MLTNHMDYLDYESTDRYCHLSHPNLPMINVSIAPMRHELEDGHEFDFVEGVATAPMSQGTVVALTHTPSFCRIVVDGCLGADVAALASPDQSFYAFYDPSDYHGLRLAVDQLTSFVENEGPFDGVIGFSGGAVVAAMCILDKQRRTDRAGLPFRYAIFVSSAKSKEAMVALGLDPQVDIIRIPTAHIWGRLDSVEPSGGPDLSKVCKAAVRSTCVHDGGHEFPRDMYLTKAVQTIRRTLAMEVEEGV